MELREMAEKTIPKFIPDGVGTIILEYSHGFFKNSESYKGFVDSKGRKTTAGINYYKSGKVMYKGEIKAGECHGKGKCYSPDGKLKYSGMFKHGFPDGYGKSYHDNGIVFYKGEWKNGQPEGKGIVYNKQGFQEVSGQWKNGYKCPGGKYFY